MKKKAALDTNNHIKLCSQILDMHNETMRIPALAELGRLPVSLKTVGRIIVSWAQIVTSDADFLHSKDIH